MSELTPGTLIGNYEILEPIGEGGMATVYKVRHRVLQSIHALKVLDSKLTRDDSLRERFLSEGRIQASLKHPAIVAVTDIVAQPGIAGLVAEFVEGRDLAAWIVERGGTTDPKTIKAVFMPVLDALVTAHDQGIVHRDVKPSNIIMGTGPDGSLQPKVLDFGIAKVLGDDPEGRKRLTKTGARLGTVFYMSPEQVLGKKDIDARTDVFALAVTLFEFVTGEVPFEGESDFDTMKQIVDGDATPVLSHAPGLDPHIEQCISQGLATDKEQRLESCRAFKRLLGRAGGPRGRAPRARGGGTRSTPLLLAALLLLLVAGCSAWWLWPEPPGSPAVAQPTAATVQPTEATAASQQRAPTPTATPRPRAARRGPSRQPTPTPVATTSTSAPTPTATRTPEPTPGGSALPASAFPASGRGRRLVVGTGKKFPPMYDFSGSSPAGFDVDFARLLADRLGKSGSLDFRSGSGTLRRAANGSVDLSIAALSIRPERLATNLFSNPYLRQDFVAIAAAGRGSTVARALGRNPSSLSCTVGASPIYRSILDGTGCSVSATTSTAKALRSVARRGADFTVVDSTYDLSQISGLSSTGVSMGTDTYGVAMQKGNRVLKRAVDAAIADLEADGTLGRLRREHGI